MKTALLLLLLLLVGCEKILPAPELARPIHIEIHVQAINALVVLDVDGKEITIEGRGTHLVKALVFPDARRMRVVLVYGKKATIAIHDYVGGRLYEPGEIKGGESFGI